MWSLQPLNPNLDKPRKREMPELTMLATPARRIALADVMGLRHSQLRHGSHFGLVDVFQRTGMKIEIISIGESLEKRIAG